MRTLTHTYIIMHNISRIDTIIFNFMQQKLIASTVIRRQLNPKDASENIWYIYPLARNSLFSRSANFICDYSYRWDCGQRTSALSLFRAATKRRCGACVRAATHTNNEISLPQDNTVMHAWPDSVAPTGRRDESYTPNNGYRGKLHVPCVPLRNSAVTLLSLARNHYGLRESYVPFFFFTTRIFATRYRGRSGIVRWFDLFDYWWRERNRKQPRKLESHDTGHRECDFHALSVPNKCEFTLRDVCTSTKYMHETTIERKAVSLDLHVRLISSRFISRTSLISGTLHCHR